MEGVGKTISITITEPTPVTTGGVDRNQNLVTLTQVTPVTTVGVDRNYNLVTVSQLGTSAVVSSLKNDSIGHGRWTNSLPHPRSHQEEACFNKQVCFDNIY